MTRRARPHPTTRTFPLPCTTSSLTGPAGERSKSNQLLLLQPTDQLFGRLGGWDILHIQSCRKSFLPAPAAFPRRGDAPIERRPRRSRLASFSQP